MAKLLKESTLRKIVKEIIAQKLEESFSNSLNQANQEASQRYYTLNDDEIGQLIDHMQDTIDHESPKKEDWDEELKDISYGELTYEFEAELNDGSYIIVKFAIDVKSYGDDGDYWTPPSYETDFDGCQYIEGSIIDKDGEDELELDPQQMYNLAKSIKLDYEK